MGVMKLAHTNKRVKKLPCLLAILTYISQSLSCSRADIGILVFKPGGDILQLELNIVGMPIDPFRIPRNDKKGSVSHSGMIRQGRDEIHYLGYSAIVGCVNLGSHGSQRK